MISGPEFHHGRDVLRLKLDDQIEIIDGKGKAAQTTVIKISKHEIIVQIDSIATFEPAVPKISLATAIPKFSHQEALVQMTAQIGISAIFPIIFERSSVREKFRSEKWYRWTIEAAKQSGLNHLPLINELVMFIGFVKKISDYDLIIAGHTKTSVNDLNLKIKDAINILIIVGPEGGFTQAEILRLNEINALPMKVGSNVLRIETAAVGLTAVARFLTIAVR